jgi:hypothetical protein
MPYQKPNKDEKNEAYLRSVGFSLKVPPYEENTQKKAKLFLIVCEGKNTEPEYFKSFPVPSKTVEIIGGKGSKSSLVKYALDLKASGKYENHEIWCVFDFDIKPDEGATQPADFNRAIIKAELEGLRVAWSNDAFELWFVLHYHEIEQNLTRKELYLILKNEWQLESFKNEAKTLAFCQGAYERHGGDKSNMQKLAIKRATRLNNLYNDKRYHKQSPCTTVYKLVVELNKYLKE